MYASVRNSYIKYYFVASIKTIDYYYLILGCIYMQRMLFCCISSLCYEENNNIAFDENK
jgi:hypothetical protein